ncbi:MAG: hypothetical protein C3F15_07315 [Holophagae bacterium]|nr:MAG: hypothetical protein C3F15_07315 [Holophagae bacterium]
MAKPRILPRLLLAAAVSALTLVVAELAVRVIRDPRPIERQEQREIFPTYYPLAEGGLFTRDGDERLRYRLTPGFDMELDGRRYRVSSLGLRGGELSPQRPAGGQRVVVLGDSFAFGLGVDEDETFAAQLEALLRRDGRRVEVANLGVPGYHTGQELAWLERAGFALDPDLVVLLYYGNDEIGEAFQYDPTFRVLYGDALPVPYRLKGVLARSAIYRWLARADIGRLRRRGDLSSLGSRHWPVTEDRLERLFRACAERDTPLIVANLPLLWSSQALADPAGPGYENSDRVNRLAERDGVPLVDLRPVLLARRLAPGDDFLRRLLISPDPPQDHHLTAEGYAIIATAVAEQIAAQGLLPAP